MTDQELKNIWHNADDGKNINLNIPQLSKQLTAKMKKIDSILFFRDAREIIAATFVICYFGYNVINEKLPIIQVVNVLIIIWAIYVIYRLLDVRKYKKVTNLNHSLKAQLMQQKMYLKQQAYLLNSALYWYIAPPATLAIISILGRSYTYGLDSGGIALKITIILAMGWAIYIFNKKAAKSTYIPLITNIDNVLVQLTEETL